MKKTFILLIAFTFSLLTSAQQTETTDLESDKTAVKTLIERFLVAAGSYDVEAMPEMFCEKANIGGAYLKNGKWNQKHWGNTNFVDLCNELKKAGFNPVLFGDEIDNVIDGQVIEKEADVTNLCGKLALEESLGTIARCI